MLIKHQHGTALLTVLFILVLLSTLAVYTAEDESIAIRRAENQRDVEQSHQVALAGEMWVVNALERDLLSSPSDVDYFGDEWALLQSTVVKVEDGEMAVQAIDEGGKFNLNNLLEGTTQLIPDPAFVPTPSPSGNATATAPPMIEIDSAWFGYFKRLLANVGLDEGIADAVVDWVDEDDEPTGTNGAEDAEYSSADTPYLAANQAFSSISELTSVAGFGDAELARLLPYITALPVDKDNKIFTKINLNTAPQVVLSSLDENPVDALLVENFVLSRPTNPVTSAAELYKAWSLSTRADDFDAITTVNSAYFSAESCARFGRVQFSQQSLLHRDKENEEVTVISRQRRYNCGITRVAP